MGSVAVAHCFQSAHLVDIAVFLYAVMTYCIDRVPICLLAGHSTLGLLTVIVTDDPMRFQLPYMIYMATSDPVDTATERPVTGPAIVFNQHPPNNQYDCMSL